MRLAVLCFVAAIACLHLLPTLPPVWPCAALAGLACLLAYCWHAGRIALIGITAIAVGLSYGAYRAQLRLDDRLAANVEQQPIEIVGQVLDLPQITTYGIRVRIGVEQAPAGVPSTVLLTDAWSPANWQAGQRWRMTVKLKRPHGLANPGGTDYEAFLLGEGVGATGSIVHQQHTLLNDFVQGPRAWINALRGKAASHIRHVLAGSAYAEMLVALVVGDQSGVTDTQWTLMRQTGAVHLVSISGMHITMLAGVAAALVNFVWRRSATLTHRIPARKAAWAIGFLLALTYAVLAGLRLPTVRALDMLAVAALAQLSGRSLSVSNIWFAALGLCVVIDPWAVLSIGFWLSFLTVGALLWVSAGQLARVKGWRAKVRLWGASQWAATLGSAPILVVLFQQLPLASPLAYASAIPLACGLVTPLALLGSLDPSGLVLHVAHAVLAVCMKLLALISHADLVWRQAQPPLWTLLPAAVGVILLLQPRGMPAKGAAFAAFLPLLFPMHVQPSAGSYRVTIYDVGQGLSVLVRTSSHTLLFDTASSTTTARVLPAALQAAGVSHLDALVLSDKAEGDSGGAPILLPAVRVDKLIATQADDGVRKSLSSFPIDKGDCEQTPDWSWDGVRFSFINADMPEEGGRASGRGCVLKLVGLGGAMLLMGDINASYENQLVREQVDALHADVMLMPHHGAQGAWSKAFLAAVSPKLAVASVGYANPFHQPRAKVLAAYQAAHIACMRTDQDGAISVQFTAAGWEAQRWREQHARYWNRVEILEPTPSPDADGEEGGNAD